MKFRFGCNITATNGRYSMVINKKVAHDIQNETNYVTVGPCLHAKAVSSEL